MTLEKDRTVTEMKNENDRGKKTGRESLQENDFT